MLIYKFSDNTISGHVWNMIDKLLKQLHKRAFSLRLEIENIFQKEKENNLKLM